MSSLLRPTPRHSSEKWYKKRVIAARNSFLFNPFNIHKSFTMKLTLTLAAVLAVSTSAVSAYTSGTLYTYVNSIPHPKTTFLKKGSGQDIVTDGVACKGSKTLPGKGHPGALYGEFTPVKNQWDFNGQHDNEYAMGKNREKKKK